MEVFSTVAGAVAGAIAQWSFTRILKDPFAEAHKLRTQAVNRLAEHSNIPFFVPDGLTDYPVGAGSSRMAAAAQDLRSIGIDMRSFAKLNPISARLLRVRKIDFDAAGSAMIGFASNMNTPGQDRAAFRQRVYDALAYDAD